MLLQTLKLASLVAVGFPAGSLGRSIPKRTVSSAQSWVSSNDGTYQLSNYTAPTQGDGSGSGISSTWTLAVDDTSSGHKQTIDGFGGMSSGNYRDQSSEKGTWLIDRLLL